MGQLTHYREIGYIGVRIENTLEEAEEVLQRVRVVKSAERMPVPKRAFIAGFNPDVEAVEATLQKLRKYEDKLLTTHECCVVMLLLTEMKYHLMALCRMLDLLDDKRVELKLSTIRKKRRWMREDRREVREE